MAQVSKRILEKLERGKRLSTEDILLLYMDMTYTELRDKGSAEGAAPGAEAGDRPPRREARRDK